MELSHGFIKDGVLYREALGSSPVVLLKTLTDETQDQVIAQFEANFEKLEKKLKSIEGKINGTDNKGSFFSALMNIKIVISDHNGLGDYQSLLDRISKLESLLTDYIAKNRQKNTDIKQALLLEMQVILANNDMQEAFEQIKDLKIRWIKTGSPDENLKEELESKFKLGVDGFFEKRKSFLEAKNLLNTARKEDYEEIINEISEFTKKKDFSKSFDKVKALQIKWKEAGRIPEAEFKKLNDKYWKVSKDYFEKQKEFRASEKKNKGKSDKETLEERKSIIEKLKSLIDQGVLLEVKKELDALIASWKKAGHLPKQKFSNIHDDFLQNLRILQEQQFVLQLSKSKVKGFNNQSDGDKLQSLTKTLRNLLRRDKEELTSFSENMGNMHINKGSFVDMLESKLKGQQDKVDLKESILKRYKSRIDQGKSK